MSKKRPILFPFLFLSSSSSSSSSSSIWFPFLARLDPTCTDLRAVCHWRYRSCTCANAKTYVRILILSGYLLNYASDRIISYPAQTFFPMNGRTDLEKFPKPRARVRKEAEIKDEDDTHFSMNRFCLSSSPSSEKKSSISSGVGFLLTSLRSSFSVTDDDSISVISPKASLPGFPSLLP